MTDSFSGSSLGSSRRTFMSVLGKLAASLALTSTVAPSRELGAESADDSASLTSDAWDLSWIKRLDGTVDKAVFDWPSLGDPADPTMLYLAERYLDNCREAYGEKHEVRSVLNIRTQAVPAALSDELWSRFHLGVEYNVKDPNTGQPAEVNPFLHRSPKPAPDITVPMIPDMVQRGAIVLVCNFALRNMSRRIAGKTNANADDVHAQLRAGLIGGAYAVPSGIFGLARAQNAGCALVRV